MSLKTLRRFYVGVLAIVAVWPFAQWYLVHEYDVNPWKLCGFAMYCTPHKFGIDVIDTTTGRRQMSLDELEAATDDEYGFFYSNRRHLGKLCSPQSMADTIFAAAPEIQSLAFEIHVMQLNSMTSSMDVRSEVYDYRRPNAVEAQRD